MLKYTLAFIVLLCSISFAQSDSAKTELNPHLVKYYFVLLKHGPNRSETDTTKLNEIQAGHMANIQNLAKKGLLMLAGPFGDENGGGIFILKTETYEEAEKLCNQDPAIISGRLVAEIRPWYTVEGAFSAETKK